MEDHSPRERAQKKKENPNPGSDDGIFTTFAQIREQAVNCDWVEEVDYCLENGYQTDFTRIRREEHRPLTQGGKT
jgi:hypothetical protein